MPPSQELFELISPRMNLGAFRPRPQIKGRSKLNAAPRAENRAHARSYSIFGTVALYRAAFSGCVLVDLSRFPIRIDLNQISPWTHARCLLAAVAIGIVSRAFSAAEIRDIFFFPYQFASSMHAALLLELRLRFRAGVEDGANTMPFTSRRLFGSK